MSPMLPSPCICLSHRAMRTAGLLATKPTLESAFANESKRRARRQRRSQLGYSALETGLVTFRQWLKAEPLRPLNQWHARYASYGLSNDPGEWEPLTVGHYREHPQMILVDGYHRAVGSGARMSPMLPSPCICLSHRAMRTAGLLATKPTLESAFANESKRRARRQRRSQLGYSAM